MNDRFAPFIAGVQANCHTADAKHARSMTLCTYLLEMRELYRWEHAYAQTAVAPWSVRPLPGAPVAVPLAWRDLEKPGLGPRDYTVRNVFRRVSRRSDPWAGLRRRARSLGPARERLERLRGAERA